jgi:hypothetical protein
MAISRKSNKRTRPHYCADPKDLLKKIRLLKGSYKDLIKENETLQNRLAAASLELDFLEGEVVTEVLKRDEHIDIAASTLESMSKTIGNGNGEIVHSQ